MALPTLVTTPMVGSPISTNSAICPRPHAHFDDAGFVVCGQLEQGLGQADFIIIILFCLQYLIFLLKTAAIILRVDVFLPSRLRR